MSYEDRVRRLERQQLFVAGFGAVGVACGLFGLAPDTSKEVRCSKFTLVDENNVERVEIDVRNGHAGLALFGPNRGAAKILLTTDTGGPTLLFTGRDGEQTMGLASNDNGEGSLVLSDKTGPRAIFSVFGETAGVTLVGKTRKTAIELLADDDSHLCVRDAEGRERVTVGVKAKLGEFSMMLDEKGNPTWLMPMGRSSEPKK